MTTNYGSLGDYQQNARYGGGDCPNCGYCKHCGRSDRGYRPFYFDHLYRPWQSPIYCGTDTTAGQPIGGATFTTTGQSISHDGFTHF